jgi:ADP-ribosylglycohydrolase
MIMNLNDIRFVTQGSLISAVAAIFGQSIGMTDFTTIIFSAMCGMIYGLEQIDKQ